MEDLRETSNYDRKQHQYDKKIVNTVVVEKSPPWTLHGKVWPLPIFVHDYLKGLGCMMEKYY